MNFPVGFSPDRSRPIPGRYIQLPIGLMYLGIQQAAARGQAGIQPLELAPQQELVRSVQRSLQRRRHGDHDPAESLLSPRW